MSTYTIIVKLVLYTKVTNDTTGNSLKLILRALQELGIYLQVKRKFLVLHICWKIDFFKDMKETMQLGRVGG